MVIDKIVIRPVMLKAHQEPAAGCSYLYPGNTWEGIYNTAYRTDFLCLLFTAMDNLVVYYSSPTARTISHAKLLFGETNVHEK